MPQWLKPIRLSFWPAIRFCGSTGLTAIPSSAWRRKVQSWLTRTLLSEFRWAQPSELLLTESDPPPLSASARSRASFAACSRPADSEGAVLTVAPDLMTGARSCPVAAFLMWFSFAELAIGVLTTRPMAKATNARPDRIRRLIAPSPEPTDLLP